MLNQEECVYLNNIKDRANRLTDMLAPNTDVAINNQLSEIHKMIQSICSIIVKASIRQGA